MIVKTWLFLKDYGIKEDELQAILNYLLTIHEVIFNLGVCMEGEVYCFTLWQPNIWIFSNIAFFMPQDGSVEEVANIVQLFSVVCWIANILAVI